MRLNRGFSVLELLGSACILSAAAAVLAPLSQDEWRQKQTTCLTNVKQLSQGFELYKSDSDDRHPLTMSVDPETKMWKSLSAWTGSELLPFPYNWRASQKTEQWDRNINGWANSVYPYVNNRSLFSCPEAEVKQLSASGGSGDKVEDYEKPNPDAAPAKVSYTMNGLLHNFDASGIINPSELPMVWEGLGKVALSGFAATNPSLKCFGIDEPCTYLPHKEGTPCPLTNSSEPSAIMFGNKGGSWMPAGTYWIHGAKPEEMGMNIAYCDTHAKWLRVGVQFTPEGSSEAKETEFLNDAFTRYDHKGFATHYWSDGCWPILFRPDYDFKEEGRQPPTKAIATKSG